MISHRKAFIFLKTRKTASTSLEVALEPYCRPEGAAPPDRRTGEVVTEAGIVGARGPGAESCKFYNHMPARAIRSAIGGRMWKDYTKVSIVRNPYDKAVSWFWMQLSPGDRRACQHDFSLCRQTFNAWLRAKPRLPDDKPIITIARSDVVDVMLRYEQLEADFAALLGRLGIGDPITLPRLKAETRVRPEPFAQYYDAAGEAIVAAAYRYEMARFGYARLDVRADAGPS
nr:sulfotransferase family 2 domain-containing protein [Acuticoccus kalidii]